MLPSVALQFKIGRHNLTQIFHLVDKLFMETMLEQPSVYFRFGVLCVFTLSSKNKPRKLPENAFVIKLLCTIFPAKK